MPPHPSPKITRLMRLAQEIRAGRARNRRMLAERLGCTVRSVARLLGELEMAFGWKVEFDRTRGDYRIVSGPRHLPGEHPHEDDITDSVVTERLLDAFPDSGLAESLRQANDRWMSGLPTRSRDALARLRDRISARGPTARLPARGTVTSLARALRDRRPIKVDYASNQDPEPRQIVLWPVHLANLVGEWYLFAARVPTSRTPQAVRSSPPVRQYALARMSNLHVLPAGTAEVPDNVERRLKKRFRRFVPPDPFHDVEWLKVRFTANAAPWVLERQWHSRETRRRARDGTLLLSFPMPSRFEALQWVLRWGPEVEVLEPRTLRHAVAEVAGRLVQIYADKGLPRDAPERCLPDGLFDGPTATPNGRTPTPKPRGKR